MLKPGTLVRWHHLAYYVAAVYGHEVDLSACSVQKSRTGQEHRLRCCVYSVPVKQLEVLQPPRKPVRSGNR